MINKNLYNPLPIHSDTARWYDRKKTYKGTLSTVAYNSGYIPAIQLTCGILDIPTNNITWGENQGAVGGTLVGSMVQQNGRVVYADTTNNLVIVVNVLEDGRYTMTTSGTLSVVHRTGGSKYFTKSELTSGETLQVSVLSSAGQSTRELNLSGRWLNSVEQSQVDIMGAGGIVIRTITTNVSYDIVPAEYRTSSRYASMFLGDEYIAEGIADGCYYLAIHMAGGIYYTEPFSWLSDMSGYVKMVYRRSIPLITGGAYIPFECNGSARSSVMYIKGEPCKPPYKYVESIADMDGYARVKKQVSYKEEQLKFLCSGYTSEAIRMMWHCDTRQMAVVGEDDPIDIDYMEPPQVSWEVDSHLCEVTLLIRTDTIMQTNGTSAVGSVGGGSFNGDYNNDY